MKSKFKIYFSLAVIIGFIIAGKTSFSFAQVRQKNFIYDPMKKKDPFIPLLDKDSPTGLRTIFTSPKPEVKLPVKIAVEGILWNGQEYFTIINNKVLKKGQSLGKVKIKEIKKDRVILKYGKRKFTVFLRKVKEK